jgi:hypothetical protein
MAMVEMKNLKVLAALAMSFAVLGCGKANVKFSSSKSVTSVQTASGELQVVNVTAQWINASSYLVTATLTHMGSTINLSTNMTAHSSGMISQNVGSNYYAMGAACSPNGCGEMSVVYNYGNYETGGAQFAVLYKVGVNGSVTKESEAFGTSFDQPEDAYYTLVRMKD